MTNFNNSFPTSYYQGILLHFVIVFSLASKGSLFILTEASRVLTRVENYRIIAVWAGSGLAPIMDMGWVRTRPYNGHGLGQDSPL